MKHPGTVAFLPIVMLLGSAVLAPTSDRQTVTYEGSSLPSSASAHKHSRPIIRLDLRQYGFIDKNTRIEERGDYSSVSFLSDSLLLVSINQRVFQRGQYTSGIDLDEPSSKVLVLDLVTGRVLTTADLPVLKDFRCVAPTHGGRFVFLSRSGLQLCSSDLHCTHQFSTSGPLFTSPSGRKLIVGGNRKTVQTLVDVDNLTRTRMVGELSGERVVPGDESMLVLDKTRNLYVQAEAKRVVLPIKDGGFIWPSSRFISNQLVAGFDSRSVAVVGVDAVLHYRIHADAESMNVSFVTAGNATRFAINETGYTRFNSMVNFLDIDQGRNFNYQRVSVIDTQTGKVVFQGQWDPRPFQAAAPALSPNGQMLAVIHNGVADVYQLP